MSKYARSAINKLDAYVPGEQPGPGEKIIKLNTNENPYPPAPEVLKLISHFPPDLLRKYSQPEATTFRRAAGKVFKIDPDMILAGNGSDELLSIIVRTFVDPGQFIAYPTPTYSLYPVLAKMQEARIVEVPFDADFNLPKGLEKTKAKVTFIANPNAPSGTFIDPAIIAAFAKKVKGVVVIDEAYVDFAQANCLDLVRKLPNVIVLRTLSKSYSLAGLRFGFALASKPLLGDMLKVKDSYNCDAVSIAVAAEAVKDQKYLKQNVEKIRQQRTWLTEQLRLIGFIVLGSQANFIWATIDKPSAKSIYLALKQSGILVRYFDKPGLKNGLRISIGRPEENQKLVAAIKRIITS
ncbi:MAG: histidinol-phosphate transaminase [Phycisphaerae bacterium]